MQQLAPRRLAEVLVDRLLDLGQRALELLHHAAHRLAIGHAAIEVFHPRVQRLGLGAATHAVDALGQTLHALGLGRVVEVGVLERGFEVEHRGGHFHGQGGRRYRRCGHGLRRRAGQGTRQLVARRVELLERLADEVELLVERGQAVHFPARHGGPAFLGRVDPLAGLHDPRRVVTAQRRGQIVHRRAAGQVPGLAHGGQARGLAAVARRRGLRAEEEQVLRQALRHVAGRCRVGTSLFRHAQLRQQARRDALAVDVRAEQLLALGLEERGGDLPQRGQMTLLRRAACGQGREQVRQRPCRSAAAVAHQRQGLGLDLAAHRRVGRARRAAVAGHVAPLPVDRPQVGRMHAVRAGQFLHRTVLGEQRQRRHRLAREQAGQVVEQRERGLLQRVDGRSVELDRAAGELLQRSLAGAQHLRRRGQAHEFQRAHALVDLRARAAQHARIDRVGVRIGDRVRFLEIAAHRLVRRLERTAQLVMDPGQRRQVFDRLGVVQEVHRGPSKVGLAQDAAAQTSRRRGPGYAGPLATPP